jgi:hypothetical protein
MGFFLLLQLACALDDHQHLGPSTYSAATSVGTNRKIFIDSAELPDQDK